MRKPLLMAAALLISAVAFGQKKELKEIEKQIRKGDLTSAQSGLNAIKGSIEGTEFAPQFYFLEAQANIELTKKNKSLASLQNATAAFAKVKQLEGGKGKYTNQLQSLADEAINFAVGQAQEKYKVKDYKNASIAFEQVYRLSARDTVFLYNAAVVAVEGKDYDKAVKLYSELKDLGYDGAETLYIATNKQTKQDETFADKNQAELMVKAGTHEKARVEKTPSKRADIIKNIAFIYVEQKKVDEAIKAFEDAKKAAPAIIFIDEIDAVGRQRGVGLGGGNDEREQTLNQLLIEMDGFEGNEGIIVIAATNRSDVLDPALLRPGRFDRKVLVGRPDVKGREAILRVHAKNKPLATDVDLKLVAQQTPGFVGADLENVLNEAALVAARRNKKVIDASDIDEAEDRVIAGPSKKDKTVSERDRQIVAYHEAGHTIVGLVLSNARVVHKVTIVPRGRAGGYMIALPKEDQMLLSKEDMKEQLAGLMGGRVAEEIIFNVQTTGASNDFEQATQMARSMVTEYGMSDKLGPVQYEGNHAMIPGAYNPPKSISEQTAYEIDAEVRDLLNEARNKAAEIIQSNRETHKLIAEALLKYETLDSNQIKSIYETGKISEDQLDEDKESHALSYDEIKSKMEENNSAE